MFTFLVDFVSEFGLAVQSAWEWFTTSEILGVPVWTILTTLFVSILILIVVRSSLVG